MSQMRHRAVRRVIGAGSAVGIVAVALVGASSPASAATTWYVGLTAGAGGSCAEPDFSQIQSAVTAAAPGDSVHICAGTHDLTAPVIVDKNLSFVGDGNASTIVTTSTTIRLFNVTAGTAVSFDGLALTYAAPLADSGGAIRAAVPGLTVTVSNCDFGYNVAVGGSAIYAIDDINITSSKFAYNGDDTTQVGGAVYSLGGDVTITDSAFRSNMAKTAPGVGGAVVGSAITVSGSDFTANASTEYGGALVAGFVDVSTSTFSANSSLGGSDVGFGGAIWADSATITTSSFRANSAGSGGAVGATGGIVISRSTFNGNGLGSTFGGAVRSNGGVIQASNSTFVGNEGHFGAALMANTMALASDTFAGNFLDADGIGSSVLAGTMSATNTIFADESGWSCQITPLDGGGNLSLDETCPGTRVTLAEVNLQPLADNGGPTLTMALGSGSAAIDAGVNAPCIGVPDEGIDQRGATRPAGAACDSGAFEVGPVVEGQLPPPWYQAIGRASESSSCPDGYLPSWAEWPNEGKGGFTCEKTTFWSTVTNGWVTKPGFVTRSLHRPSKGK